MSKTYISNLNSLSALFDRLIVENVKMHHFQRKGEFDKTEAQKALITALQEELVKFFMETLESGNYNYLSENRTFKLKKTKELVEGVSELCECHSNITHCDQTKLQEVKKESPNAEKVFKLEYQNRVNLERRATIKNQIDKSYEDLLHPT